MAEASRSPEPQSQPSAHSPFPARSVKENHWAAAGRVHGDARPTQRRTSSGRTPPAGPSVAVRGKADGYTDRTTGKDPVRLLDAIHGGLRIPRPQLRRALRPAPLEGNSSDRRLRRVPPGIHGCMPRHRSRRHTHRLHGERDTIWLHKQAGMGTCRQVSRNRRVDRSDWVWG